MADGLINVSPIDIVLMDEVQIVVQMFATQAEASGIALTVKFGKEIPPDAVLHLDPTRLSQMLVRPLHSLKDLPMITHSISR